MERKFLPYSRQCIDESDIKAVVEVLKSDYITQGPVLTEFEKALATFCHVDNACVIANGSAALQSACFALGLSNGDEVLVPNNTFVAGASCVVHCGGIPVFVDSEPGKFHMSISDMEKKITKRTVGIIPMHYGGLPCDMKRISQIAKAKGLWIIEDASHSIGASYEDDPIGNCRYSDIVIFSFHPVKPLCAGEGGAILTNRSDICQKVRKFMNNGITKDSSELLHPENSSLHYAEMHFLGFNYRITEMQCALGLSQLKRLHYFIEKRNAIAKKYYDLLSRYKEIEMPLFSFSYKATCAYHLFPVLIDFVKLKKARSIIMKNLRNKNIGTQVHYIPLSRHLFYQEKYGYCNGALPNSENIYEKALSIPVSVLMNDDDVKYVCRCLINEIGLD